MQQRLLFVISGLGMGNATRCDAIIQNLSARGFKIDLATSGNGLGYFHHCPNVSQLYELESFYYCKDLRGKLSAWRTWLALPDFAKIFWNNLRRLSRILGGAAYSAIIIDSDYTVLGLQGRRRPPIIAINNADVIIDECRKLPQLPPSIRTQYVIERWDAWFHRSVPDLVLSPWLRPRPDHASIKHISLLVREGMRGRPFEPGLRHLIVMLSGSGFGSDADFLRRFQPKSGLRIEVVGRDGQSTDQIVYHGKLFHNQQVISRADMLVINGGFSAISEAVALRKPAVIIPIEKHAEQLINALTVQRLGLGLIASLDDVVHKMNELIDRFPQFVEAHRRFQCHAQGADEAASWIARTAQKGHACSASAPANATEGLAAAFGVVQ